MGGLQVLVGNVTCEITQVQESYLEVVAPDTPQVATDGNADIIVSRAAGLMLLYRVCS